eukprot:scaffold102517_cov89-Attheya_sp.AAC.2
MHQMFRSGSSFNQDLSAWDVSSVKAMQSMFRCSASAFNQNLSAWNVSSVTDMQQMFCSASAFNQDLCAWASKSPQLLSNASVDGMFLASSCSNSSTPVLNSGTPGVPHDGPFCFTCPTSNSPSIDPSSTPSVSMGPFLMPSVFPTVSVSPSKSPSSIATLTIDPSSIPSLLPLISVDPVSEPSARPSVSLIPSTDPSIWPSEMPSSLPSVELISKPTDNPLISTYPSEMPSSLPSSTCELAHNCTVCSGNQGIPVNVSGVDFKNAIRSHLNGGTLIYGSKITCWDVSEVTNMDGAFDGLSTFDDPLCWDVSSITTMNQMFYDASAFNQDLSAWDVSNVTAM